MSRIKDSRTKKRKVNEIVDGRLIISCDGCKGPSSLSDRQCLLCVCNAVSNSCDVSSVILRSSVDVAIDPDAIAMVRELAFVYEMLVANRSERMGRKCAYCKRSFSALVKDQRPLFPDIEFPVLRERMSQMQFNETICTLCAGDTLRLLDAMEATIAGLMASEPAKGVD